MKIIKTIILFTLTILFVSCNGDDYTGGAPEPEQIHLTVIGRGTVLSQSKTIVHPKTGETLQPDCFLMDLIDPDTGNIIGTLEDCVVESLIPSDGTITSRVVTSINIDGRGTIQAENIVFQEILAPLQELNFSTLFIPTENNVINTTFEFEGMEGTVALEGEVNLLQIGEGIVTFNCTFTINLTSY
ncbi:MAG: hypothetical protein ABJN84_12595 [Flavobacteriaceae bacterium]